MRKVDRESRHAIGVAPEVLGRLDEGCGAWYETEDEVQEGLAWGVRKAHMLRWVRRQMGRRLTSRERHCVELYFFYGMTYRQLGEATNTNVSSAYRAVARGLRKLRQAAREDSSWRCPPKRGRVLGTEQKRAEAARVIRFLRDGAD